MKSQTTLILEHLRKGKKLTSLEALDKFGCMRLASRIDNIRNGLLHENELLHSVMITRNNKRIAQYSLTKCK